MNAFTVHKAVPCCGGNSGAQDRREHSWGEGCQATVQAGDVVGKHDHSPHISNHPRVHEGEVEAHPLHIFPPIIQRMVEFRPGNGLWSTELQKNGVCVLGEHLNLPLENLQIITYPFLCFNNQTALNLMLFRCRHAMSIVRTPISFSTSLANRPFSSSLF